jgi:hypothetical protein
LDLLVESESQLPSAEAPASVAVAPTEPAKPQTAQHAAAAAAAPIASTVMKIVANPAARALQVLAAGTGASAWLPQAADVIEHVASIEVAAVERKLQGLLQDIESMTVKPATAKTVTRSAIPLTVAAAVFAAAQLAIIRLRLPKGGPILVFNSINSSWSWVLGNSSSTERRP